MNFQLIILQQNRQFVNKKVKIAAATVSAAIFFLYFVRLLAVMGQPFAFGQRHVGKDWLEGGLLGRAGIDAEADLTATLPHMADPHLREIFAVGGTLNAVIVLPAAEAIPHGLDGGIDGGGGPVGVAVVGHHTAQVLELLVFVFNRAFQPILAVQIHHNAALVEPVLALKFRLNSEGEE